MEKSEDRHDRTRPLLPPGAMEKLAASRVLVAGLGGVGSFAVEALVRAGVGSLVLVDGDVISPSNLNRQLYALERNLGLAKCDLARDRALAINSKVRVDTCILRLEKGQLAAFLKGLGPLDYIVDAIDSLEAKVDLLTQAVRMGIPVISSMGTGNRLDPEKLMIADLAKSHTDPLARRVRQALRKEGIEHLPVVFSTEEPSRPPGGLLASMPYLPPVAGFLLASRVIRDLAGQAGGPSFSQEPAKERKDEKGQQVDHDNDGA